MFKTGYEAIKATLDVKCSAVLLWFWLKDCTVQPEVWLTLHSWLGLAKSYNTHWLKVLPCWYVSLDQITPSLASCHHNMSHQIIIFRCILLINIQSIELKHIQKYWHQFNPNPKVSFRIVFVCLNFTIMQDHRQIRHKVSNINSQEFLSV